jgi:hypothetical protein
MTCGDLGHTDTARRAHQPDQYDCRQHPEKPRGSSRQLYGIRSGSLPRREWTIAVDVRGLE